METKTKLVAVNLFASPGSGKSTTAAYVFYYLKTRNCNVELVREFAKDLVYEGSYHMFKNQLHVTSGQYKRMKDIDSNEKEDVKLVITDCSILMGAVYSTACSYSKTSNVLLRELHDEFDNVNVFVKRVKKYNPKGRMQTSDESDALSLEIKKLVPSFDYEINGDTEGQEYLASQIYEKYKHIIAV
jgi:hypothetical protein